MKTALSFVISMLPFCAFSQAAQNVADNTVISSVTVKLDNYNAIHPIEKAYLQFDKPYYAINDTIYFKAYLALGAQHKLSALSGILYVDLIAPGNKIARSIKLQVMAGTAHGDFALADTLNKGNYRVRAYTNWMRNTWPESFFEQVVPVGATLEKKAPESSKPLPSKPVKINVLAKQDIQFLPEGGSLIAGNYSTVAFKAIAPEGMGTAVKGTLTDSTGTEIITFASVHLGMGSFSFVPQAGKIYFANVTYADGATQKINLPSAVNTGYTINVNNANADTIRLRIAAGSESPKDKLSLVAQSGGVIYYAVESGPFDKFFPVVIPKSKFPAGIVQFTLFSKNGEPLNERVAFINNDSQLHLNVLANKTYTTRQKVNIELNAGDKDKKPVTGSFSVSVTDETAVPIEEQNGNNILTNLLLTSDLKGTVEQPNYYFTNVTAKTQTDLDLLMLTQGYRQFTWKQVLNDKPIPPAFEPEKTMQISGIVIKRHKPAAGAKVSLITNKGGFFMIDTVADNDGRFAFKDLVFVDSTRFVVQSRVKKGQDAVTLTLDTILPPQIIAIPKFYSKLDTGSVVNMSAYIVNQKKFYNEQQQYRVNKHPVVLKEVIIKDKKYFTKRSKNPGGGGNADFVVTADDLKDAWGTTLSSAIMLKVWMYVGFGGGKPFARIRQMVQGPMLVTLDGNPIDYDFFNDLDAEDIQSIEVMVSPGNEMLYGPRGTSGVLEITSKRAGDYKNENHRYAPGVVAAHPTGFYKAREFYSPQYDNPKTHAKMGDYRSTIYWKPDLITDKDGKAMFSFFNSDNKGTYRVVVEGIDTDGNIGRQVYKYTVQ